MMQRFDMTFGFTAVSRRIQDETNSGAMLTWCAWLVDVRNEQEKHALKNVLDA
jgi:hypothetical protein